MMHLRNRPSTIKYLYNSFVSTIVRRHITTAEQSTTARSFLTRFIEDRRRRLQHDDIRLEPYSSKGVYTESGAIRPVSLTNNVQLIPKKNVYFRCQNVIHWVLSKFFYL